MTREQILAELDKLSAAIDQLHAAAYHGWLHRVPGGLAEVSTTVLGLRDQILAGARDAVPPVVRR